MTKEEIKNLIKELIEKTAVKITNISIAEEDSQNIWVSIEVNEPHFFISREGEGLHALSHLVHRIVESRMKPSSPASPEASNSGPGVIIDINGFQKKRVENVRAVAHMMSERARYFKSNVEFEPMSAFERRIVHEFLSNASDMKTESVGVGNTRRVVIKYIGTI